MKGKDRCKILKDIRKRIADENDIEFITSECKHKGDCLGTCPKCESELRYLERELEKRRRMGKKVAVAGLALSVSIATSSCSADLFSQPTAGVLMPPESSEEISQVATKGLVVAPLDGEIEAPPETEALMGVPIETEPTLMGDMPPEETEAPDTEVAGGLPEIPGEIVEETEIDGELAWPPIEGEIAEMGDLVPVATDVPDSETVETVVETPVVEFETETDAPVSETVETVAETPIEEN